MVRAEVVPDAPPLAASETDSNQALFVLGGVALQQADYKAAIAIFRDILRRADSPRVRLELARAYYLDRQFLSSEQEFKLLLASGSLPWQVRKNVRLYLRQIDRATGYLRLGLGMTSDSNPLNFTSEKTVRIAGQTLTVVEPKENKQVYGIRYQLEGGLPLSTDLLTQGYGSLVYQDFKQRVFDRYVADVGVRRIMQYSPQFVWQLGTEFSGKEAGLLYTFPYVGLRYYPDITREFAQSYEVTIGTLNAAGADHLDAHRFQVGADFTRTLQSGARLQSRLNLERSISREAAYTYNGAALELGYALPVNSWELEFSGVIDVTHYAADDPFFGETRRDLRKRLQAFVTEYDLELLGMHPQFGISYERVDSSIGYFSFDKLMFHFQLSNI